MNPKEKWKSINNSYKNKQSEILVPCLDILGKEITDSSDIANELNSHVSQVGE